jgi:hypothetical protein
MFATQSATIKSILDLLNHSEIRLAVDVNNRAARSIFEVRMFTSITTQVCLAAV